MRFFGGLAGAVMSLKIAFDPNACGIARSCSQFCKVRFQPKGQYRVPLAVFVPLAPVLQKFGEIPGVSRLQLVKVAPELRVGIRFVASSSWHGCAT